MIRTVLLKTRSRTVLAAGVLCGGAALVALLAFTALRQSAIDQASGLLRDALQSQAAVIQIDSPAGSAGPREAERWAALRGIFAAGRGTHRFGATGEIALARLDGNDIVFVAPLRHGGFPIDHRVAVASGLAEPMLQALRGRSGALAGLDYRGVDVLAAYRPLETLGLGIVAKIDLAEVTALPNRIALLVLAVGLVAILLTAAILLWLTQPITRRSLENEARVRSIVETAVDAIITIDPDGIVRTANSATERLFGYPGEEIVGRNVNMLMPSPDRERHDSYLANYLRSGEKRIIGIGREVKGRRKDGSLFPLLLGVSEVRIGGERTFTGIVHDLTERERMEAQLRSAHSLSALGMIARGVAHHFNNCLQIIGGASEMLQRASADSERGAQAIDSIERALARSRTLTQHLLSFSGSPLERPVRVRIAPVLQELAELLRPVFSQGVRVQLQMVSEDAERAALADSKALRNALLQICLYSGARMDRDGELTLSLSGAAPSLDHRPDEAGVVIRVHDTGSALSPEERAHLFETGGGAGAAHEQERLGLVVAHGIVRGMNGQIAVASSADLGTTLSVTLPPAPNA